MIFTRAFWKAAAERAIKSAAQAVVLVAGVTRVAAENDVINAFDWDFANLGGIAIAGAVLSLLTSIVSAPFGGQGPSLGGETTVPEDVIVVSDDEPDPDQLNIGGEGTTP